jgi:hypothetical protein
MEEEVKQEGAFLASLKRNNKLLYADFYLILLINM